MKKNFIDYEKLTEFQIKQVVVFLWTKYIHLREDYKLITSTMKIKEDNLLLKRYRLFIKILELELKYIQKNVCNSKKYYYLLSYFP